MNSNIVQPGAQPLSMSSREIAELCDKRHDNVMVDIIKMLTDIGLDVLTFQGIYKDARDRDKTEYRLPKDLTVTLITGYRANLRYKVVKRLEQLKNRTQSFLPSMILENTVAMRGLLLTYTEKVIALQSKVEGMAEDVAANERLTKADGSLNCTEAAKNLGICPKDLFDLLSHNGWTYMRQGSVNLLGDQTKCNQVLLEQKTTTVLRANGSEKITKQVRITAKGLSTLSKLIQPKAKLIA